MKQFLYRIILMLVVAFGLTACADDFMTDGALNGGSGNNGGIEEEGEKISLAMMLALSDESVTYNKGSEPYNEILIDEVRIVLYGKADDATVQHILDMDVDLEYNTTSKEIEVNGSDVVAWRILNNESILIQTEARVVPKGEYDMLIIVNPNQAGETGKTIKELTDIGEPKTNIKNNLDAYFYTAKQGMYSVDTDGNPTHFLMLNSQGLIAIDENNFYDTKKKAEENPVPATVERVAAKVEARFTGPTENPTYPTVKSSPVAPYGRFIMLLDYKNQQEAPWGKDYDIPEDCLDCPVKGCGGKFNRVTKECSNNSHIHTYDGLGLVAEKVRYMVATDLTWQVDIVNKKSFWLRELADKANGSGMETQGDYEREVFYAKDPNYTNISGSANLKNEFNYITEFDASAQKLLAPPYQYSAYWSWDAADTKPVYIPENTMEGDEQRGDVATRVIFRAILKREQFKDIDTYAKVEDTLKDDLGSTKAQKIGDFFVLKIKDAIDDYKYNNYNKDNTTFYILRPEDVKIYAMAIKNNTYDEENVHIYLRAKMKAAIEDFEAKYKTAYTDFKWDDISNQNPFAADQLSFFKDGTMYYAVPIKHFTLEQAGGAGKYGRFGVVRNNWYKLNVQNLISIGQPIIPPATSTLLEEDTSGKSGRTRSGNASDDSQIRTQSIIF